MDKVDNSLVNLVIEMSNRIYLAESRCHDLQKELDKVNFEYKELSEEYTILKDKVKY